MEVTKMSDEKKVEAVAVASAPVAPAIAAAQPTMADIVRDPNAPINAIADYVINGTVEEVVPKLIKYYKQNSK